MVQALVPLKDLVQAKTRLAGVLRPSERRALAQAMAEDVLNVLANHGNVSAITLVSDDPGADLLAQKYGADRWSESALGGGGLNALIKSASERLLAEGKDTLLVLHADLPLLGPEDISEVLRCQEALGGMVIGSDRHLRGTNLLAFDAASMPARFCFGADSCSAHAASARGAGVPVQILQRSGISVDVDEARDLKIIMERLFLCPGGHTAQLLHQTGLGARLDLALATVPGDPIPEAISDDNANRGMPG